MQIIVQSDQMYQEKQQFNPVELISKGNVQLFHIECAGGKISLSTYDEIELVCSICKEQQKLYFTPTVQALRIILTGKQKDIQVEYSSLTLILSQETNAKK